MIITGFEEVLRDLYTANFLLSTVTASYHNYFIRIHKFKTSCNVIQRIVLAIPNATKAIPLLYYFLFHCFTNLICNWFLFDLL